MSEPPEAAPRIAPLQPPYASELEALLRKMTPPQAPNVLALFRTLAHHPALAEAMTAVGRVLLGRQATLPLRAREVVIARVCARCGAEYEWGVHVAAFAESAGLTPAQHATIAEPAADDAALTETDRQLVRLVDELHDGGSVSDALWAGLAAQWSPPQLIELLVLAGWYHAISYVCTGAQVPLEPWAARWRR
jgi:4-carboxymuconolactone decarboxylase